MRSSLCRWDRENSKFFCRVAYLHIRLKEIIISFFLLLFFVFGKPKVGWALLGQIPEYNLFPPPRGFLMLNISTSLGFMLYFFHIGLQIDSWIIQKMDEIADASRYQWLPNLGCSLVLMKVSASRIHALLPNNSLLPQ